MAGSGGSLGCGFVMIFHFKTGFKKQSKKVRTVSFQEFCRTVCLLFFRCATAFGRRRHATYTKSAKIQVKDGKRTLSQKVSFRKLVYAIWNILLCS